MARIISISEYNVSKLLLDFNAIMARIIQMLYSVME